MEIQELKRTIIEMKKCTKGIQQKIGLTGERISKLEDRDYVIQRTERIKNKEKKNMLQVTLTGGPAGWTINNIDMFDRAEIHQYSR